MNDFGHFFRKQTSWIRPLYYTIELPFRIFISHSLLSVLISLLSTLSCRFLENCFQCQHVNTFCRPALLRDKTAMDTPTEVDGGGNGDETDQTACASDSTQSDKTLINRDLNSGMFICV